MDDGGYTPRPLAVDVVGTIREPSSYNGPEIPSLISKFLDLNPGFNLPSCVVYRGKDSAVLRVAQLSDKQRCRAVSNGNTQSEEEASGYKHLEVDRSTLENDSQNHDDGTNADTPSSTHSISDVRNDRQGDE